MVQAGLELTWKPNVPGMISQYGVKLCEAAIMGMVVFVSTAPQCMQERVPSPVVTQVAGTVATHAPQLWSVQGPPVGSPEDLLPQAANTSIAARAIINNPNTFFIFPPKAAASQLNMLMFP